MRLKAHRVVERRLLFSRTSDAQMLQDSTMPPIGFVADDMLAWSAMPRASSGRGPVGGTGPVQAANRERPLSVRSRDLRGSVPQRRGCADSGHSPGPQWNREARPSRDILGHTSGSSGGRNAVVHVRLLDMPTPAHINSSSSVLASFKSAVSKPSVNQS
jgi:hypothetical protein